MCSWEETSRQDILDDNAAHLTLSALFFCWRRTLREGGLCILNLIIISVMFNDTMTY